MKISRTSLRLFALAVILFAAAICSLEIGKQIKIEEFTKREMEREEQSRKRFEETGQTQYWVSGGDEFELNIAECITLCFFLLTVSSAIAAIWLRKSVK